ncbi:hypothetical protein TNCV_4929371 [Trichonephila clavipes]|nr:hypothetical protein TNCV_4929371 [Trichonephila clavipes]
MKPSIQRHLWQDCPRDLPERKRFAWMEMKTIMSAILRNYTLEPLDSREKVLPVMKVDLVPSTDIRIRIRPRKIAKS